MQLLPAPIHLGKGLAISSFCKVRVDDSYGRMFILLTIERTTCYLPYLGLQAAASAAASALYIYYVVIGGRFAPPYKYMAKYIKLMCCQKYPRYYVSQGVPRVQVLKISKEEPWDTLIPRILLQPHEKFA